MYAEVLEFWFSELSPQDWWKKDGALDLLIERRFLQTLERAKRGELFAWREQPEGRLAEIIVLDQFSRNIYRDTAAAFAQDTLALVLSQEAVRAGVDKHLSAIQCHFLYMPYMHSESVLIHEQAEQLFRDNGLESEYRFELRHKAIIDHFGRYPHRNAILGRESSEEELEFLKQPGSGF
ncbi:DUF924 family protein [Marinobacterium lutimaris]|uniref:Uncharacterized conserved protein, DUF924 family n=1 Tax=Marinobacterium lutimaris TaxID=568106 RepID=A0A1H5YYV0_9GAMM|nr:DUF924 family protein [Marinobacterium lutimaris]SEG28637.1 Uncharacterized conserved protein, DUF924 family [Marinobacterium lutimaris]